MKKIDNFSKFHSTNVLMLKVNDNIFFNVKTLFWKAKENYDLQLVCSVTIILILSMSMKKTI